LHLALLLGRPERGFPPAIDRRENSVATSISPGSGTASVKLGGRGDDANHRLQGDLDEAAIYDRALTAAEIEAHHLTGMR
jgi:hypothetical protein